MKQIFTHILILLAISVTRLQASLPDCHADFDPSIDAYSDLYRCIESETGDISYVRTL
ncbi:MAG: hypothetical protein R2794_09045 [Chitinophagales bacterium]